MFGKKAVLSSGSGAVEAAAASSRVSARPVPQPKKEGHIKPRIGWRACRELRAVSGSASHPRGHCPAIAQSLESQLSTAVATLTSNLGLAWATGLS